MVVQSPPQQQQTQNYHQNQNHQVQLLVHRRILRPQRQRKDRQSDKKHGKKDRQTAPHPILREHC
jgi:hypothetical protein